MHDDPAHHHDHHPHAHSEMSELSDEELRVRALESLLVEKGYVESAAVDALADLYETKIGPRNGARVIARAWNDAAYRRRLLTDGTAAIAELSMGGRGGEHMIVVENTPEIHNVIVCTLCSCYPWPVLGLPPIWYKSAPYRSRVIIDPRGVLKDFGVSLPETTRIRVWDSNSELRYLVLPMRPVGTDGWGEDKLASLVTRNAMIGTGLALDPNSVTS